MTPQGFGSDSRKAAHAWVRAFSVLKALPRPKTAQSIPCRRSMRRNAASRSRLQKWSPAEATKAKDLVPAFRNSMAASSPGSRAEGLMNDALRGSVRGSRPRKTVGTSAKSAGSK